MPKVETQSKKTKLKGKKAKSQYYSQKLKNQN